MDPMDKAAILPPPKRPISGGTNEGARPRRYDYWRTGYCDHRPPGGGFWVAQAGEYHCKPAYVSSYPEHHKQTQFFYHLAGEATFSGREPARKVRVGDLLIIPPDHIYRYRAPQGMKYQWFALGGSWPQLLGKKAPSITPLDYDPEIVRCLVEMREILILQQSGYTLRAIGIFYQLLARRDEIADTPVEAEPVYPAAVHDAIIYLQQNYAAPFSATETAAATGVSPSYLRTLFAEWLGEPPRHFHLRCRIDKARQLLTERPRSISGVAFEVGFSQAGHFSRIFKQIAGIPPSHYRKRDGSDFDQQSKYEK